MHGDLPPPCLAHSSTLVGQKIIIIARGERASYHSVHVFNIPVWCGCTRRSPQRVFPGLDGTHDGAIPKQIWLFSGGNRLRALNDFWDSVRRRLAGKDKVLFDVTTGVGVYASQPRCVPSLVLAITLFLTRSNIPDWKVWTRIKSKHLTLPPVALVKLPTCECLSATTTSHTSPRSFTSCKWTRGWLAHPTFKYTCLMNRGILVGRYSALSREPSTKRSGALAI